MKNSEAKTKICPFMGEYLQMSIQNNKELGFCICEQCMAWESTRYSKKEKVKVAELQSDNTWIEKEEIMEVPLEKEKHEGYCKRLGK